MEAEGAEEEITRKNDPISKIVATCSQGHVQTLTVQGVGREWLVELAGLIGGKSCTHIYRPGENAPVGKCGTCGSPFTCEIVDGIKE